MPSKNRNFSAGRKVTVRWIVFGVCVPPTHPAVWPRVGAVSEWVFRGSCLYLLGFYTGSVLLNLHSLRIIVWGCLTLGSCRAWGFLWRGNFWSKAGEVITTILFFGFCWMPPAFVGLKRERNWSFPNPLSLFTLTCEFSDNSMTK